MIKYYNYTKTTFAIIFFSLLFNNNYAQVHEFGKVTIDELKQKFNKNDTSAVAAILFKKGDINYVYNDNDGFTMITVVKTKIKIYKKEGYDYANEIVEYYIGGTSKESVTFDEAITYNLVNEKIEKTKAKKESEFDENINKYWNKKKLVMPNVKVGSIIEFQYTIRSKRFQELRDWYFQYQIPVEYSEFTTVIPEFYVYNSNQKGFLFPRVTTEKKRKRVHLSTMLRENGHGMAEGQKSTYLEDDFEYDEIKTNYISENLSAMKDEAYVNNINNYMSCVSNELNYIAYPNKPLKTFTTDWKAVTKTIYDEGDFSLELDKTGYFDKDIDNVISGLNTSDEKISVIFNFLKSKLSWNKSYGLFCNSGVRKAYLDKVGNVAEINLILTSMLRYAGLKANPVLVSTRSNGIAFFPSITAFNYVICAIELPEGIILLDATDNFSIPNILPTRVLNWKGRMIRNDGTSEEVDLMPKQISNEVTNIGYTLNLDGTIVGKLKKQYFDYLAWNFRDKNNYNKEESYLEQLETSQNIIINEYTRENSQNLGKPIIESYSFSDKKSCEIVANKLYFSPLLFLASTENPFKQESREFPIDFSFPISKRFNVLIDVPEGYIVESIPTQANINIIENIGNFKYLVANTGNKIQVSATFSINQAIVPADYYEILKSFFKQVIEKQTEKIVLKKI
ncbi:DUF3857 domain-containing protein [Flavobacterium sp. SUN052]|uniref:DUF3857 domain-containing protein n=1 Tax=Flavobacterium sp. SUN052 TaxID=3002441 RepID=UPI00237E888B|nr:DUF3857 domain-containing protein [Flavobacterium sp. SUN052]MEC4004685.1 DUF3857 domain-containing protein [Flavobacterium sp. SUN052]